MKDCFTGLQNARGQKGPLSRQVLLPLGVVFKAAVLIPSKDGNTLFSPRRWLFSDNYSHKILIVVLHKDRKQDCSRNRKILSQACYPPNICLSPHKDHCRDCALSPTL